MWKNTVSIHSISKKINYKTKFSINSILKENTQKNGKKKKTILGKKKQVDNIIAIYSVS